MPLTIPIMQQRMRGDIFIIILVALITAIMSVSQLPTTITRWITWDKCKTIKNMALAQLSLGVVRQGWSSRHLVVTSLKQPWIQTKQQPGLTPHKIQDRWTSPTDNQLERRVRQHKIRSWTSTTQQVCKKLSNNFDLAISWYASFKSAL